MGSATGATILLGGRDETVLDQRDHQLAHQFGTLSRESLVVKTVIGTGNYGAD